MTDFDVNFKRMLTDDKTTFLSRQSKEDFGMRRLPISEMKLFVGQSVAIYGTEEQKKVPRAIKVAELWVYRPEAHDVGSIAVIDSVLPPSGGTSADRLIRADGYIIRITPKTETKFVQPLSSAADIGTNVVVKYRGVWQTDGVVVAKSAVFYKNQVSERMSRLREHWDYDPNTVPADSHQSLLSKGFRGMDASQFPTHKDAAMQERINAIGGKLVPAYQKSLAAGDPTRIDFRFHLIDAPNIRDAFPLPSGIILVPYQVVERMQNDSQLAAVLAEKIACLMEQQPIALPLTNGQVAGSLGMTAASFVPFAGLGVAGFELGAGISVANQMNRNREQRERVSLPLMLDAGYDLMEAPKAWWILSAKRPVELDKTNPPEASKYMYDLVGNRLDAARTMDRAGRDSLERSNQ
jgi:hypothetical protein